MMFQFDEKCHLTHLHKQILYRLIFLNLLIDVADKIIDIFAGSNPLVLR
jgi:hypothetical protein